jgi:tRNA G26 N,N-dimethylase Trm1
MNVKKANKKVENMSKKQISELVNKLKNAGIKASLTKPKSNYLLTLQQLKKCHTSVN